MEFNFSQNTWFFIITAFIFGVNIIWYSCKFFVKSKGYKVNYLSNHSEDFRSLYSIIQKGNSTERFISTILFSALVLSLIAFFVIVACAFIHFKSSQ